MDEISKTISEILKVDDELSGRIESAKAEARKMLEFARSELEDYKAQKYKEIEQLREVLSRHFQEEKERFKAEVEANIKAVCSSIKEISESRIREVVDSVASKVFNEIVNGIFSNQP